MKKMLSVITILLFIAYNYLFAENFNNHNRFAKLILDNTLTSSFSANKTVACKKSNHTYFFVLTYFDYTKSKAEIIVNMDLSVAC